MPIVVNLDVLMARRKISLGELAARIDLTPANLSVLKNNHARAVRFSTLDALCRVLDCQPGEILEYIPDKEVYSVKKVCKCFILAFPYGVASNHEDFNV